MKQSSLSRLPRLVRSIFLPRKTAVLPASTLAGRIASLDAVAKPSVETVLRQVTDVSGLVALLRSPEADTARDAAIELGHTDEAAAVEPLIDVLTNAEGYFHPVVRAAAARSLGELRDVRAIDALITATGDTMAEVSEEATLALGHIGNTRAMQPLMNIVANKAGYFLQPVRRAAIISLGEFRDARVLSVLLAVSMNESEDPMVRQAAKDIGARR